MAQELPPATPEVGAILRATDHGVLELSDDDVDPVSVDKPGHASADSQTNPFLVPFPESDIISGVSDAGAPPSVSDSAGQSLINQQRNARIPPPPSPRSPRAEPVRKESSRQPASTRSSKRRPGWEKAFADEFVRAYPRLTHRQVTAEVRFIERSLGIQPGGVVLDLGCGIGQHAVELASRGYNVVGYDLSLAMLAIAADEAQDRGQKINLLQGDMREMAFEEMFDGVYSWTTSFGFFDDEKNLSVIRRVQRALRKGGMFLLDLMNRDFICSRLPSLVWFEGDGCVCIDDAQFNVITSRLHVKRTIMIEDGTSRDAEYTVRLYSLHEIGKILHETGFKVVEVSGHPSTPGAFFCSESPRVITLAVRR